MRPAVDEAEQVGPYRILKAIGAGGSARIDLARIERAYGFQRHVVIKRPLEHLRADAAVATSLRREAQLGGRLRHPNLVAVLDAGTHDGYDYLALEYVHGTSLRALMQTVEPGGVRALPLATALSIAIDIARGLHVAHELTAPDQTPLGLVHRDVSPSNVLLGADGTVKLSDFGIAKDTRVSTLSGSMRGTVTYMAPEQCRGHAFDRRADVFSLGVILFELLTGRRLFWADNDVASLHKVLSGAVPDPRSIVPSLDRELAQLVLATVAAEASARVASAADLADALESIAARLGLPTNARQIAGALEASLGVIAPPWIDNAVGRTSTYRTPVVEPEDELSLVEVIENLVEVPDDPPSPAFGDLAGPPPPSPAIPPPMPRAVSAPPAPAPRSNRRGLVAVIAVCAAAGIVLAIMMSRTGGDAGTAAATVPAPAPAPATAAAAAAAPDAATAPATAPDAAAATAAAGSDEDIEMPGDAAGSSARPKRRARKPISAATASPAPTNAVPIDAGVEPIDAPKRSVEWRPDLLLPTDKGGK